MIDQFNEVSSLLDLDSVIHLTVVYSKCEISFQFYVFARHGKTKNLAIWSIRNLARSNANLEEFCQPVGHPNETFILPEGGIGGCNGLRCKFIMIEHYRAKEEIIL